MGLNTCSYLSSVTQIERMGGSSFPTCDDWMTDGWRNVIMMGKK